MHQSTREKRIMKNSGSKLPNCRKSEGLKFPKSFILLQSILLRKFHERIQNLPFLDMILDRVIDLLPKSKEGQEDIMLINLYVKRSE